jgi:hypothetical protein
VHTMDEYEVYADGGMFACIDGAGGTEYASMYPSMLICMYGIYMYACMCVCIYIYIYHFHASGHAFLDVE